MNKFILPIILIFASVGFIQAQNVGIGTSTPSEKIHVVGNARITALGGVGNALVLTDNNGVLSRTALTGNGTDVLDGTGTFVPIASLIITGVTAGAGLTGGGTSGALTLTAAADNGLYVNTTADKIRMGGPLVENTTITEGAFHLTHNLTGTGDFRIQDLGVNHFEVRDNGLTFFGDDTYWRDGSTAGTNLARLYDSGNDGVFQIYQDGVVQHTIHGIGTTVFNERGLNYDTRIESDLDANMVFVDASTNRVGIGTGVPTAELTVDGWIGRTAHNNGALAGSYNSVGANSLQSNPIYIIGTGYKPAAAALNNMYGIGYTHTNASFINGAGSWGMYVAADGDARIWFGASAGGESYFNTGGFFGLNTNAPTRALDVNGTVRIRGGAPTAGDFLMCQDGAGNATWSAAGYGMVPIGTIVGWHGNMAGVPGLPAGWYECNGQTVADAASPMNGVAVPNLNNATTSNSGDVSRGRFLRGNTTSGLYQTDQANNLDWVNHDDSGNGDTDDYLADEGGVQTIRNYSTSGDRFQLNVDGYETRPTNMTVRWIIRVK